MKIKNISNKVINIGPVALLPDKAMPANQALCDAPVIKHMVGKKKLSIVSDKGVGVKDTVDGKDVNNANKQADEAAKKAAELKKAEEAAAKAAAEAEKAAAAK